MIPTLTFPTFLFHAEHARDGKLFQTAGDLPTDLTDWHDTPQKFDPAYVAPPQAVNDGTVPEDARRTGYVPQPYPSVRYNKLTLAEQTVASAEADALLDPAVWKHSPDPKTWEAEPAVASDGPGESTVAILDDDAPPAATASDEEQKTALHAATVTQIVERVSAISDEALLAKIDGFERDNPKGMRKTVISAVKARLAELHAPVE